MPSLHRMCQDLKFVDELDAFTRSVRDVDINTKKGRRVHDRLMKLYKNGQSAAHACAKTCNTVALDMLLTTVRDFLGAAIEQEFVCLKDVKGETALNGAIFAASWSDDNAKRSLSFVDRLLQSGADAFADSGKGTPLYLITHFVYGLYGSYTFTSMDDLVLLLMRAVQPQDTSQTMPFTAIAAGDRSLMPMSHYEDSRCNLTSEVDYYRVKWQRAYKVLRDICHGDLPKTTLYIWKRYPDRRRILLSELLCSRSRKSLLHLIWNYPDLMSGQIWFRDFVQLKPSRSALKFALALQVNQKMLSPWSYSTHRFYPKEFKRCLWSSLMVLERLVGNHSRTLIGHVAKYLAADCFGGTLDLINPSY